MFVTGEVLAMLNRLVRWEDLQFGNHPFLENLSKLSSA